MNLLKLPFTLSLKEQQHLERKLFQENIQRCKLVAKTIILFESILIIMTFASSYLVNRSLPIFDFYLMMYFVMIFINVIILLFFRWYEKGNIHSEQHYKIGRNGLFWLVNLLLIWGSIITLADQQHYGQIMAVAINFMGITIVYHASNRTILKLFILPLAILYIGLPFFQTSSTVLTGHYINLSIFIISCWIASRILYVSYCTNYYNKQLLQETNEKLILTIEENKHMNKKLEIANEQLKQLSIIDELTKIPNRRSFHEYIQKAFNQTKEERFLSLMMIDIDSFKLFNDYYGHLEGDTVLRLVAQTINSCIDHSLNFSARFGGEEFIVVVFDTDPIDVYNLAESIRHSVEKMKIIHEPSPVSDYVTVSIGLAMDYLIEENEITPLMEKADRALYKAKSHGRNKVMR